MIVGLHHVAISVSDIVKATRFYCDVLGFEEAFESTWDNKVDNDRVIGIDGTAATVKMVRAKNAYLELWQYASPTPAPKDPTYSPADHGLSHLCLQVTNIQAEYDRLSARGMTFHGPPVQLGSSSAIYGRDPFGNIIELYEVAGQFGLPAPDPVAERLGRLEDIEAIHRLKAAYCAACDNDHDGEAVSALFIEGGTWTNSMHDDVFRGREEIRGHFDTIRASGRLLHSSHLVTNPVIDVSGNEASGTWSMLMMYTGPDGSRFRIVGFYRDQYVKRRGRWWLSTLFAHVQEYTRADAVVIYPRP